MKDEEGGQDELARRETAHLEHPRAVWTSFDRYSRYGHLAQVVRANLGPGRHRVLDVGDSSGYLRLFDEDLDVVSVDIAVYGEPLPGTRRVQADGVALPFADGAFDAVVSSDALEHVPRARRGDFLQSLARVSAELVAVAAPFDTPGVGGAEEVVRRYVLLSTGAPQEQLEEHRDYGLPDLDAAAESLRAAGMEPAVVGNGNLHDWVAMMLLKHQTSARAALVPLEGGYDIGYNFLFADRAHQPPFYRHLVVASRSGPPQLPARTAVAGDPLPLLAVITAAGLSEVVRQDVVPLLLEQTGHLQQAARVRTEHRAELTSLREAIAQVHAAVHEMTHVEQHREGRTDDLLRQVLAEVVSLRRSLDETRVPVLTRVRRRLGR